MQTKITKVFIEKAYCIDCGFYEYLHTLSETEEKDCSNCYSENIRISLIKTIKVIDDGNIE